MSIPTSPNSSEAFKRVANLSVPYGLPFLSFACSPPSCAVLKDIPFSGNASSIRINKSPFMFCFSFSDLVSNEATNLPVLSLKNLLGSSVNRLINLSETLAPPSSCNASASNKPELTLYPKPYKLSCAACISLGNTPLTVSLTVSPKVELY